MEPPVVRSRGRPRKRRRKEDENDEKSGPEAKRQVVGTRSIALVGRYVLKEFLKNGVFLGKVVYYECGLYRVTYEDGDFEDLDSGEIRPILLKDCDFDDELTRRKQKLEKLVLKNSNKAPDVVENGSAELNKVEPTVDAIVSGELNGGVSNASDEEQDEGDADSLSGSEGLGERDFGSDAETLAVPPPLQLPPSSGTVGVPEIYVSHLFSVYGFLRSFSTRLFLTPFTLDDFVGALNCRVANTLFDAIHVSLMRALKHNLETLSSEGSTLASKCLRCSDWGLLDTLTWPVFLIQYLVVNGYIRGPEWKGFYDEVFTGEYYLLPVSRKLVILQILCDDVLESEELKAEMNMREESEVGLDYDAEDILPAEIGPRRVHPRYAKTSAYEDNKEAMKIFSASNAVNQNIEDGDVDTNGDECRLCGMDGTLLCCDGCPSAYHSRCIGVMKMHIPDGPWYCPECKINMIGPTITKGTSLRGAEIFGKDSYGQLFMGTCGHLLVVNINNGEFGLKYYNQNDVPNVLQVLYGSLQHRPIYHDICIAVLHYWSIPESFLPLTVSTETNVNSANKMEETKFSTSVLPPSGEDDHNPVSLVNREHPLTTVSSMDASSVTAPSSAAESSGNATSKECRTVNTELSEETRMEAVISAGSVSLSHLSDAKYKNSVNISSVVDPAMCSLENSQFGNYGHANDMVPPLNFSLQTKESTQVGFRRFDHDTTNDFVYMGFSYKPLSYINYYMHGDFAASAAAKLAILSSEESRSEGHVSDNHRRTTFVNTYLQAKAFSLTASRFFWPSSEKKLVEVPRERCGWCFSCKAPVSSKRGCMLNHAVISATKSAVKTLAGLSPVRSGEGILPSIATYIILMEECLRGLIVGRFLNVSYRKQWRKRVEQATTLSAIKLLLLELEESIRMITFCGDWVKLVDDWLVDFSIIQNAASTLGTSQKRAPSGRRHKKRPAIEEAIADKPDKSFEWWRGGKFTKFVFQKAVLPKSMVRKAARQGGLRKISGILYADGSEIPKRSRQLGWRVAVQMSRTASQLALQVRYLDFYLRWSDLIRPEQNIPDGKGQETEASAFRNANICDTKLIEGKSCYAVAFGSQKHLPSRVMKNVVEIEQGPEGKEKYWFSETRIPLYLVKEYEEVNGNVPSDEGHLNITSHQLHRRRLKATCRDIFFYLTCKRDNLDVFPCAVCQMGVLTRNALKCNSCQGYCHEGCSISSTVFTNEDVEYLITCNRCYHAKLLAQKETSNESPTSPLLLQGRENSAVTVLKGSRPLKSARTKANRSDTKQVASITALKGPRSKCNDQALTSTRTKNGYPDMKQVASNSTLPAKSGRRNCSWGVIWKKKSNDDTGDEFRLNSILLKGGSGMPQLKPVCHLCRQPYRSDLMYVRCETCSNWYHAEAVELEESKIFYAFGFKCCKCRRIKSPTCPYTPLKPKIQEGKKTRSRASKKEHSEADSETGAYSDMKECEPATPVFPVENDPLLFSLSSVELITERKPEADVEWNTVSGPMPQKLPVRRHVKREGDSDGSFRDKLYADFLAHNETGDMSKPADVLSSPLEHDSNLHNDSKSEHFECMDFEPHTYFSLTELLHTDDNSSQFEVADVSGDLSGYIDNDCSLAPEEFGGASLVVKSEPADSIYRSQFEGADVSGDLSGYMDNDCLLAPEEFGGASLVSKSEPADSIYSCWQCSLMEPAPDLCCEICGIFIHSQCSPWLESPSRLGSWRCGNCREWQ